MSLRTFLRVTAAACVAAFAFVDVSRAQAPRFEVTVDPSARATPLTGRLVVVVSKTAQPEPRMAIAPQGPALFAIDLDQLRAGQAAIVDGKTALGYPIPLTQIPAGECLALGLVNRLCKEGETLQDAKALARQLARRPPIATALVIEAVNEGLDAPMEKALDVEVRAFLASLRTEDASEGIQAFFAKREPVFKGR